MQLQLNDYCLFAYLLIALYWDVRHSKLPNWLTAGGVAFGFVYHLIANGLDGLIFSVIGCLVAGLIFMILYVFKALGAGDVKLFAAIGAIVGTELVLQLMMYSIIFAGLIGCLFYFLHGRF